MKKTTSELFVSYRYGDDFYEVFTTLKDAEKATVENNESLKKFRYLSKEPYKTMTLADALESMKDYVKEYTEQSILYPEE